MPGSDHREVSSVKRGYLGVIVSLGQRDDERIGRPQWQVAVLLDEFGHSPQICAIWRQGREARVSQRAGRCRRSPLAEAMLGEALLDEFTTKVLRRSSIEELVGILAGGLGEQSTG